jgi:hypothetical protein
MKKVVSGGPVRAVAFTQAVAGLPDTTFFISGLSRFSGPPGAAESAHLPDSPYHGTSLEEPSATG